MRAVLIGGATVDDSSGDLDTTEHGGAIMLSGTTSLVRRLVVDMRQASWEALCLSDDDCVVMRELYVLVSVVEQVDDESRSVRRSKKTV